MNVGQCRDHAQCIEQRAFHGIGARFGGRPIDRGAVEDRAATSASTPLSRGSGSQIPKRSSFEIRTLQHHPRTGPDYARFPTVVSGSRPRDVSG